jgi:hypothetical protein
MDVCESPFIPTPAPCGLTGSDADLNVTGPRVADSPGSDYTISRVCRLPNMVRVFIGTRHLFHERPALGQRSAKKFSASLVGEMKELPSGERPGCLRDITSEKVYRIFDSDPFLRSRPATLDVAALSGQRIARLLPIQQS